jgi:glutamate decarboxylase
MGADVHTVWEKSARYFDVELRLIPLQEDTYIISADDVAAQVDENTICVAAVLGTTFTGQMDPIKEINDLLVDIKSTKGWDIPLHVDGASGAFVAPFVRPDLEWDFALEQVRSINASGHKYGLVYPGVGWLVMKDKNDLPEELVFRINYLGGEMTNYSLNFSKSSSTIIAQYYNFIRLGRSGYTDIMTNMMSNSHYLAEKLRDTGKFEIINKQKTLPLVALRLKDAAFTVFQLSKMLRQKGWIVPAYYLPENAQDVAVMRMVIKENFSRDMVELLFSDIMQAYHSLELSEAEREERAKGKKKLSLLY